MSNNAPPPKSQQQLIVELVEERRSLDWTLDLSGHSLLLFFAMLVLGERTAALVVFGIFSLAAWRAMRKMVKLEDLRLAIEKPKTEETE